VALGRMREALARTELAPGIKVSFSAGVTAHQTSEALHETLERADRGLYAAKSAGRDQIVVCPAQASPPFQATPPRIETSTQ